MKIKDVCFVKMKTSHDHLFFACEYSNALWNIFLQRNNVNRMSSGLAEEMAWVIDHRSSNSCSSHYKKESNSDKIIVTELSLKVSRQIILDYWFISAKEIKKLKIVIQTQFSWIKPKKPGFLVNFCLYQINISLDHSFLFFRFLWSRRTNNSQKFEFCILTLYITVHRLNVKLMCSISISLYSTKTKPWNKFKTILNCKKTQINWYPYIC